MKLTAEQDEALRRIEDWRRSSSQWFFYLGGFAGTGKTTLMKYFIESLDFEPHCLAPTGKAASVLMKKLNGIRVRTVHSMLYKPVEKSRVRLIMLQEQALKEPDNTKLKSQIAHEMMRLAKTKVDFIDSDFVAIDEGDLVIVDEASMVTNKMLNDLQRTGAKVLFVGDPGQLPPVMDKGFLSGATPDAMLESVQRQALDNPIIKLSMDIRHGESIPRSIRNSGVTRMPKASLPLDQLVSFDQILCGMNDTRHKINRMMRRYTVLKDAPKQLPAELQYPVAGEKLICLRNRPYDTEDGRIFVVNGVICQSTGKLFFDAESLESPFQLPINYEDTEFTAPVPAYYFAVHYQPDFREPDEQELRTTVQLDYAYAITVHKSQGSEWDHVLLVDDEMNRGNNKFRRRWLYTAVTRAKEHLTWLTQS